ncbi:hypothetical protein ACS15_3162 [Ralstonia insidiosa]|uniref:Uncharacterized protein n=1 Tax=Ralstonia insidiosa TaxID=190721 RepID=A0AAC9BHS0_9RALS|nr:hypothetical protein ACS15_3162 [Ralstonia insidiosa]
MGCQCAPPRKVTVIPLFTGFSLRSIDIGGGVAFRYHEVFVETISA